MKLTNKILLSFFVLILPLLMVIGGSSWAFADEDTNNLEAKGDNSSISTFDDVDSSAWYYGVVNDVVNDGIMHGYSGSNNFGPNDSLSRSQVAAILYNLAGNPMTGNSSTDFVDVDPNSGEWWIESALWAEENGVINGYETEEGRMFAPNDLCTREQLMCILYNQGVKTGKDLSMSYDAGSWLERYYDGDSVSNWSYEALGWGISKGVIGSSGVIAAQADTTRAQAAAMILRYLNPNNVPATPQDVGSEYYPELIEQQVSPEQQFVIDWAERLNNYLAGSPMSGLGEIIARYAYMYNVDPRWLPAIACVESGKGQACFKSFNAYGWGRMGFSSWENGIETVMRGLAEGYDYARDENGMITISQRAANKYCASYWYGLVLSEMNKI